MITSAAVSTDQLVAVSCVGSRGTHYSSSSDQHREASSMRWDPLGHAAMDLEGERAALGQSGSMRSNSKSEAQKCAGCDKIINERYMLKAMDRFWHEDCLKCNCCECRLGEVGSSLYTKENLILCKRDYLRLFGHTGNCAACSKMIPAFEMVMRARHNVYHLDCFACQQCSNRFCVGDRFYLCDNKILCEYDYEERLVFANMAYSPTTIALLKRQTSHLPPGPSPPAGLLNGSPTTGGLTGTNGGPTSSPGSGHHAPHHHSVHPGQRVPSASSAASPGAGAAAGPPCPGGVGINPSNGGGDLNNNMGGATGLGVPFKNASSTPALPMGAGS